MNVIRPTCRNRFTSSDFDFILSVIGNGSANRSGLAKLFEDPESLDRILDQEALFRALLEERALLGVSTHLYFYILVRHVLVEAGHDDRELADYVGALLAEFSSARRMRSPLEDPNHPLDYMVDMLQAMKEADESSRFALMLHLGNHALFLSGVYKDYIRHRARRRAAPGLEYYEAMGSSQFRAASDHRLASKYDLGPLLLTLADEFRPARRAINDISERLLIWHENSWP
jgi:hypothetical protein